MNCNNITFRSGFALVFTIALLLLVLAVGSGESSAEDKDLVLERRANYGLSYCYSIAHDGENVYLGQSYGFSIFDVSDPAEPEELGDLGLSTYYARGVTVEGDYAYVANAQNGLLILDIRRHQHEKGCPCCRKTNGQGRTETEAASGACWDHSSEEGCSYGMKKAEVSFFDYHLRLLFWWWCGGCG